MFHYRFQSTNTLIISLLISLMTLEQELSGSVLDSVSLELKIMAEEFIHRVFPGRCQCFVRVLLQFPLPAILQYF